MIDENTINTLSTRELAQGFSRAGKGESYRCLRCEAAFEEGYVYPTSSGLAMAAKAAADHAQTAHGDIFVDLLALGKEITGIPEAQADLLGLLRLKKNDRDIAASLGGKSPSTIRNQRRALRKREVESKIFLALMELLEKQGSKEDRMLEYHKEMPVQDDRTKVTESEAAAIERKYLDAEGRLPKIPRKEKEKLVILKKLSEMFRPGRIYGRTEVDDMLGFCNPDYAALRRYLVDYKFLEREPDGSAYWVSGSRT
jgi:hypothetical protein